MANKKMFGNIILFFIIILSSCVEKKHDTDKLHSFNNDIRKMDQLINNVDTVKIKDIDSLEITCLSFENYQPKLSTINFSVDHFIVILHQKNEQIFKISSLEKSNYLISNINLFYIDKLEPIILSKNSEPSPISDYPFLDVKGFINGKKVFDQKTILYKNTQFNPKFIEFHEFLGKLVK